MARSPDSGDMKPSTLARRLQGKRGVSKATMDKPQEEFIADEAAVAQVEQVPPKGANPQPREASTSTNLLTEH